MVAKQTAPQSGFALLLSLIVVGVLLSVGLVILDLTIKQVRLAVVTRDSEIAFHAANAGMECALYWRRQASTEAAVFAGSAVTGADMQSVSCFGRTPDGHASGDVPATNAPLITSLGAAEQYEYEFSWPVGSPDRCTRVNMVLLSDATDVVISETDIAQIIPGHTFGTPRTCVGGAQCTLIAVRGYNQPCPGGGSFGYGVVERKVLLEF